MNGCLCALRAVRHRRTQRAVGYDVVRNRPKVGGLSRARRADLGLRGRKRARHVRQGDRHGPAGAAREERRAASARRRIAGPKHAHIGFIETLRGAEEPSGTTRRRWGRTRAAASPRGFWFNVGGESSATVHVNEDGTVLVATGSPDIGGSRASMAMMAAEMLGVRLQPGAGDRRRHRLDRLHPRDRRLARDLRHRHGGGAGGREGGRRTCASAPRMIWDVDAEGVVWEDGYANPAGSNAGDVRAAVAGGDRGEGGGDRRADHRRGRRSTRRAPAPGFGAHFCDVEVDPETGQVTILRYTAAQDVGKAIHPSYVEGQIQGGVVQGIGWALNEEYIYNDKGQLDNAGLPRLPLPGRLRPADDRGGAGGGAEPAPSVRRARASARCNDRARRWPRSPTRSTTPPACG